MSPHLVPPSGDVGTARNIAAGPWTFVNVPYVAVEGAAHLERAGTISTCESRNIGMLVLIHVDDKER